MKWDLNIGLGEKCLNSFDFINRFINVSISLEDYLHSPNMKQVITYDKDKIVGLRIFKILEDSIHLTYTAVEVTYRGFGINHMMLEIIEDLSRELGIDTITSNVRKSNIASLRSLEKSGFVSIPGQNLTYSNGEEKIPHIKKLIYK
jgi:ribosomal protein S18 acetylase RimI-like enzyme